MLDHLEQARIHSEEMLAHVGAVLDRVLLILAVDDLTHALDEHAIAIGGKKRIPVRAPDHLDHVPASTTEDGLEFLDDLAVAAHRAVESLEVAVDDEDQVVQLLSRREPDRAERFRLIGFAIAE